MKVAEWEVGCDVNATAAVYAEFEGPHCSCAYCRDFFASWFSAFPQDLRILASHLGIDVAKPTEVFHYNGEDSGLHYYGVSSIS